MTSTCRYEEFANIDALVASMKLHKSFLERAHRAGVYEPTSSALHRYKLWLQLVVESKHLALVPALDVAWLWHCHRLAPAAYARACRDLGALHAVDCPGAAFTAQTERDRHDETLDAWRQRYPDVPFFDGGCDEDTVISGFDVAASARRQATFLWQVSGPKFQDESFLRAGVVAYEKYLELMRCHPDEFLVPTYQIDFVWHTHILADAAAYARETRLVAGRFVDHDDSVNDRSPDTKLNRSTVTTKRLWSARYNESFVVPGGMYRGEPPARYYETYYDPLDIELLRDVVSIGGGGPAAPDGIPEATVVELVPQPTSLRVVVPSNAGPGSIMSVVDPRTNQMVQVTLPANAVPGSTIHITVPHQVGVPQQISPPQQISLPQQVHDRLELLPRGHSHVYGVSRAHLETMISFIPAVVNVAGSAKRSGRERNPRRDYYVFGDGFLGKGYYRLDTVAADRIIVKRLTSKLDEARCKKCCMFTGGALCCCIGPYCYSRHQLWKKERHLEKLIKDADARRYGGTPPPEDGSSSRGAAACAGVAAGCGAGGCGGGDGFGGPVAADTMDRA